MILTLLLLPLTTLAFVAEAGGRWGVSYEPPLEVVAYAEQVAASAAWTADDPGPMSLVGIEALVGAEARYGEARSVTPYSALALYWSGFRLRLDVNTPVEFVPNFRPTFTWRLSIGGSW